MAEPTDAPGICDVYRPYVQETAVSFELAVPSAAEMADRIAGTLPAHPWLVSVEGDCVLGYSYAHSFSTRAAYRWCVETSIYVRSDRHRSGVGRRLYSALLAVVTAQGYREAFAGITLPNQASVVLHESMGWVSVARYQRAGWKLGSWHDVGWWQRSLAGGGQHAPVEPTKVDGIDPATLGRILG